MTQVMTMKSFADWTTDLAQRGQPKCDGDHGGPPCADQECWAMLPEGVVEGTEAGEYLARCVVCGEYTPLYCDFKEFDAAYHYCGGSPRCCP